MSTEEGPNPELRRNLVYLLKHAYYRISAIITDALTPHGLDGREMGVLLSLLGPEPPSQQQAAQRLGIDRTTMVALLDSLEAKGLVTRHPHAQDRRRNVVELTEAGRDAVRTALEISEAAEREFLAPLTPQAAEQLRTSLQKILFSDR